MLMGSGQLQSISPELWTPAQIKNENLNVWLQPSDAQTMTIDGNNVSQIISKDDDSRVFAQASAALQPRIDSINGVPIVKFLGRSGDHRLTADQNSIVGIIENAKQASLFSCGNFFYKTSNNGRGAIFTISMPGNSTSIRFRLATIRINSSQQNILFSGRKLDGGVNLNIDLIQNFEEGFYTFFITADYEENKVKFWVNGGEKQTYDSVWPGSYSPIVDSPAGVSFGSSPNADHEINAELGDTLFIRDEVSESEIRKLEGYACHLYMKTEILPENHPYKNNPPLI